MEAKIDIPTLTELVESLPNNQKSQELLSNLEIAYAREVISMLSYAQSARQPHLVLNPFRQNGSQFMAEFWVNDLALPIQDKFNFHFQNTSQWVYAGCILVQDGQVSLHH